MYNISLITGDGIGPELSESVKTILDSIHDKLNIKLDVKSLVAGDSALEQTGKALPDDVFESIKSSDACLKAPVGESAKDVIVTLRQKLDLYANIRPAKSYPNTPALRDDIDLVIVRENTEDLYTGQEFQVDDTAVALRIISEKASKRIAKYAFETAMDRDQQKRVTCVHKSNVMKLTDGLFAKSCEEVSKDYPDANIYTSALILGSTYGDLYDIKKLRSSAGNEDAIQEKLNALAKNAYSLWAGTANPDEFD